MYVILITVKSDSEIDWMDSVIMIIKEIEKYYKYILQYYKILE